MVVNICINGRNFEVLVAAEEGLSFLNDTV